MKNVPMSKPKTYRWLMKCNELPEQPQDEQEDIEHKPVQRVNRNIQPPERYENPYNFNTTPQERITTELKTYKRSCKFNESPNNGNMQYQQMLNH